MQTNSNSLTSIYPLIVSSLSSSPTLEAIQKTFSKQKLELIIIEKISNQIYYLTDGVHTILALLFEETTCSELEMISPFNRMTTKNYVFNNKACLFLNCKDSYITESVDYPHPYEPYFYFRERYTEFKSLRDQVKLASTYQQFSIAQWGVRVVNIGCTGYYGVALLIKNYKKVQGAKLKSVLALSCILYEKYVKEKLESWRLYDIRNQCKSKKPKNQQISLCYYLRNHKTNFKGNKAPMFLTVDRKQQILAFQKNQRVNYVIFGEFQGICSFQNPMNSNEIDQSKIEGVNSKMMRSLFNSKLTKEKEKQKEKDQEKDQSIKEFSDGEHDSEEQLWSDKDSSDEKNNKIIHPEVDSDSSSDEDPLKNIYTNFLKKLNLH